MFRRTLQHRAGFLQAHRRLVVTRTRRADIGLYFLISNRWKELAHHEAAA